MDTGQADKGTDRQGERGGDGGGGRVTGVAAE